MTPSRPGTAWPPGGHRRLELAEVRQGRRCPVQSYDALPDSPARLDAVGHRIMHRGDVSVSRLAVDAEVGQLQDFVDLAHLHQPMSLTRLDGARELLLDVPHVACFDTAFHATIPAAASTYALPRASREQWPIVVAAREDLQIVRLVEEVVQTGHRP